MSAGAALQGSQDVVDDDDDYFHSESILPCIPDVPDNLKSESDSVDLDELPCIVPESMMPESAADPAAKAPMNDLNEHRLASAQPASSTAMRLPAAAASITQSKLHAKPRAAPSCSSLRSKKHSLPHCKVPQMCAISDTYS